MGQPYTHAHYKAITAAPGCGRARYCFEQYPSRWPGIRGLSRVYKRERLLLAAILDRALLDLDHTGQIRDDAIAWLRGDVRPGRHLGWTVHDVCRVMGLSYRNLCAALGDTLA